MLSWISYPGGATYCAPKSATWSMTNGVRHALRQQGTQVLGPHVGLMDTDMTRGMDMQKTAPSAVVAMAALNAGEEECLADGLSRQVKQGLSAQPGIYLSAMA